MSSDPLTLKAFGTSDVGRRREKNEDVVLLLDDFGLFAVFDGAGGHNTGQVAANLASRSVSNYIRAVAPRLDAKEPDAFGLPARARHLSAALHKANRDILEVAAGHNRHRGMGTTVVATIFSPGSGLMHVAHVGDSRCYRLRSGHLEALTADHCLLNDILEQRPNLDDEVLAQLPKNVVTRALGMDDNLKVSLSAHAILGGDRYLLCSDGLSSIVPQAQIQMLLAEDEDPDVAARLLIAQANSAGGPDNIAAIVIDCLGGGAADATPDYGGFSRDELTDPELLILGIEELGTDALLPGAGSEALETFRALTLGKPQPANVDDAEAKPAKRSDRH